MKKLYIILALVVVSILMVFAGDTIKILRIYHNGIFTAIPLAYIDSIDHSKIDANIKARDSTYKIPINEIDSVVVNEIAINNIIISDDIARAINKINPFFLKCESTTELSSYISQFLSEEYIDDVWYNETTFFVKTKDGNTFTFTYPPLPLNETANEQESRSLSRRAQDISVGHRHLENMKSVYLVNQTYNDEQFDYTSDIIESMRQDFRDCGFRATVIDSPDFSFFLNDIRNCDILYLQTHGIYDSNNHIHWIYTGDEVYTLDINEQITDDIRNEALDIFNIAVNGKSYPRNYVNVGAIKEKREDKYKSVYYIKISELFIWACMPQLNNTIIFNTACESLKENRDFADYFIEGGACCYLGYTNTNSIGSYAAREFFRNLLNGKCISKSFMNLDDKYLYDNSAQLVYYPNESSNICIISPQTDGYEDVCKGNDLKYKLKGQVTLYYPILAGNTYGFCISKNEDMTNMTYLPPLIIGDEGCPYSPHTLNFEYTIDNSTKIGEEKLDYETTYYYCSYLNDGGVYCYGDIKSFKTRKKGEMICPDDNHPHMIDLGLPSGTKWSCCNIGANSPEEYGDYYAWGEVEVKANKYDIYNYKYYVDWRWIHIGFDISGTEYDVAHVHKDWGGKWQMPTKEQCIELRDNCTVKPYVLNGVNGSLLTGLNGNSLFLVAAGGYIPDLSWQGTFGFYWTSTSTDTNETTSKYAWALSCDFGAYEISIGRKGVRYEGQSVRPVSQ